MAKTATPPFGGHLVSWAPGKSGALGLARGGGGGGDKHCSDPVSHFRPGSLPFHRDHP